MTRLAEMFNVNHFIVSQVNPHVVPFLAKEEERLRVECQDDRLGSSWLYALGTLAKDEALHRMHVLTELGIFPNTLTKARSVLSQKYSGDITIFPEISYSDFPRMLNNPTTAFMLQACVSGEKATWPKLSRIRNHCALELALDDAVKHLRDRVVFSPSQIDLRLSSFNGNHPQRSHVSIRGRGRRERNMSQSSDPNQPVQAMSGKPLSSDTRPVRFRHAKAKSTGSKLMLSPTTHRPPPSFPPRPTVHVPSESSASSSPLHHPTDVGGSTTQTPQCSSDGDDDLTTDEAFSSETESGRSSPLLSIPTGPPLFPFASQPTTPHGHRRFSFLTPLVSHTTSHSDKSEHASGTITPVNPSTSPGLGLDLSMTTSASELKRHGYVPQADSSIQGSASQAGHGASSHRLGLIASLSVLDRV
jgi:TAG lipase/steryl ester hydrolase/phospholipase A2/LPA acyltransferase